MKQSLIFLLAIVVLGTSCQHDDKDVIADSVVSTVSLINPSVDYDYTDLNNSTGRYIENEREILTYVNLIEDGQSVAYGVYNTNVTELTFVNYYDRNYTLEVKQLISPAGQEFKESDGKTHALSNHVVAITNELITDSPNYFESLGIDLSQNSVLATYVDEEASEKSKFEYEAYYKREQFTGTTTPDEIVLNRYASAFEFNNITRMHFWDNLRVHVSKNDVAKFTHDMGFLKGAQMETIFAVNDMLSVNNEYFVKIEKVNVFNGNTEELFADHVVLNPLDKVVFDVDISRGFRGSAINRSIEEITESDRIEIKK